MPPEVRLTRREEQVLRHVRMGESNKEIAEILGVGEQAVKALVSRLLLKFAVPNRTSLATLTNGGPRAPRSAAPRAHRLADLLAESRRLREDNRVLLDRIRAQLREVRRARRRATTGGGPTTPRGAG